MGNICHWADFVFRMVPPTNRFPIDIIPVSAGQSDCDISVNYVFGEGTVAAITFSAKGHTFEGVRETFSGHRGDVLLAMRDFRVLTVESGARKRTMRRLFRDHGHERGIMRSYSMVRPIGGPTSQGRSPEYVGGTGLLWGNGTAFSPHQGCTGAAEALAHRGAARASHGGQIGRRLVAARLAGACPEAAVEENRLSGLRWTTVLGCPRAPCAPDAARPAPGSSEMLKQYAPARPSRFKGT